ncbi:hypothetical protein BDY19DRAFT_444646 [Irpex rosettiformis]|uniref:Uncharacterized protein n=1 Tax=Irpex rosettiformis TaxID=378272 RepID=A0ACB8TTR0_9APHY|nr:hypothetical protein BDY19DRAFT_444646 [Irpex rosettiformis]
MSSPPSQKQAIENSRSKKKDKPPALHSTWQTSSSTLGDRTGGGEVADEDDPRQIRSRLDATDADAEHEFPRSTSATSSLDPYYFGAGTPSESPIPSSSGAHLFLKTPEMKSSYEPVTPAKDPAAIDRRGLVGVGELATPRWVRDSRKVARGAGDVDEHLVEVEEESFNAREEESFEDAQETNPDLPDSPWTIEAIDGEQDESEEFLDIQPPSRALRTQRSIAEESGGEEILYPRQTAVVPPVPSPKNTSATEQEGAEDAVYPPTAFVQPGQRPRKRTSDEFELDQTGFLTSKHTSTSSSSLKEKDKARKHRSLGVGLPPSSSSKERRRDTLSVNVHHSRQISASSSSSSHDNNNYASHHSRRLHASDYSHLPPSPATSSIQQFLRHGSGGSTTASPMSNANKELPSQVSANVAHSLLRGTQEGWSDLDDQATVEALRKLDGISGRSARARSSVGGHNRVGSASRPSTPAKSSSSQWEGVEVQGRRSSRVLSVGNGPVHGKDRSSKEQGTPQRQTVGLGLAFAEPSAEPEQSESVSLAKDDVPLQGLSTPDKPLKKHGSVSKRSSFTPKRGSASSTNYTGTPTTGSRDSTSLSTATSATSPSGLSSKSHSKVRRNSAGSDISSNQSSDAISLRDRAALAAATEVVEENSVPPVPPLPKVYSSLKPPQQTQQNHVGITFPTAPSDHADDKPLPKTAGSESLRKASLDIPTVNAPSKRQGLKVTTPPSSSTNVHKTPSKKWSFTNPLGKKLVTSPSTSSMKDSSAKSPSMALSPRAISFTSHLRKSASREHSLTSNTKRKQLNDDWETINAEAMTSASSLASLSSLGSTQVMGAPASAPPFANPKTPDRLVPSRSETASSASTNLTASMPILPQHTPLSPSSSVRRGASTKRLTPSSIPFFRRSSSQSMQIPPANVPPSSPTYSSTHSHASQARSPSSGMSPTKETQPHIAIPSSSHKKSSVLSLGLPSLLKGSSSRRSLHSDKEKSDAKSAKEEARHAKESEKERHKKDDKERSESRISVLMGRKRGKTLSSAQPKKQEPVAMPPMQITALPPATAQRLANLKSGSPSSVSSSDKTPKSSASRATGQTISSMQKQSDMSLRSSRNGLPTIAGSPSVGTLAHHGSKDPPSSSSLNASLLSKETPTKIPRISSRSSATNSPTLKGKDSNRRASLIVNPLNASRQNSPSTANQSLNEFGVFENGHTPKAASAQRYSVRASPSVSTSTSRVPRQVPVASSSTVNGVGTRKNRESLSFRKTSTGSVTSANISTATHDEQPATHNHRFSALSPSKLKLLSPKISLPTSRGSSSSQSIAQTMASPSLHRQTTSTPSPVSSIVDDEELVGDEEMMQYIKRQQAKKIAAGASLAELDELLRFPEPIPPAPPASPASVLKSNQVNYLSEYECKEILEYQSVYYIGAKSDKKPATLDNTTNNHGYDDERGDYLIVMRDHLAYRYEVVDTLGKGSFGQVLHCRDHCTGESVAIKIIRNKKRFHHQALVEIKILDSLKKWDADEKHHVIKMTEHFYFRGHLCIAMELLSINLYELIKANNFVGFTTALIRRFTNQMLQSLALMRHHRIVHCDLKPENVLLRHPAKSAIKVIDFGSSCFEHEKIYTYIQSRFYRSPEVILGMNYHMAIDMWSLGCIMAELYTGFPIFPGENEQEQLSCIMEVLGVPEKEFINRSSRKRLFFDTSGAPRPVVNSKGRRRRPGSKSLAQVLKCDDEQFVDFIAKCLVWDPERRLKPASALRHPYITAGKRPKIASPPPPTSSRSMLSSSTSFASNRTSKNLTETPKKSLISAPTPLTARSSRVTSGVGPTTPSTSGAGNSTLGSSRSYRTAQSQSLTYHSSHSSRTMLAK